MFQVEEEWRFVCFRIRPRGHLSPSHPVQDSLLQGSSEPFLELQKLRASLLHPSIELFRPEFRSSSTQMPKIAASSDLKPTFGTGQNSANCIRHLIQGTKYHSPQSFLMGLNGISGSSHSSPLGHMKANLSCTLVPKVARPQVPEKIPGWLNSSPDPRTLPNSSKRKEGLYCRPFF